MSQLRVNRKALNLLKGRAPKNLTPFNTLLQVFQVAQWYKESAEPETQVRSLYWEDPLEEEMATHSSILAWKIPWTEEPSGLQFMGL